MCLSRNMGRNSSAPNRSQMTLNAWSRVQARRRQNRQGYQSARYYDSDSADHSTTDNAKIHRTMTPNVMGAFLLIINSNVTLKVTGGNVNGLKLYADTAALVTVDERLCTLQAETIVFSETNVEWHKFHLRDKMQNIFTKAFGAARMEYSTTSDKFETTYHKPGGINFEALGRMVHRIVDSGRDGTGCGRWSYLTYTAKEVNKVAIVSAEIVCKQTNPGDLTSSKQQLGIMY
jgi:hypothetical protein